MNELTVSSSSDLSFLSTKRKPTSKKQEQPLLDEGQVYSGKMHIRSDKKSVNSTSYLIQSSEWDLGDWQVYLAC
jgi:hypothetical protein